jgi:hypothetical protein
LASHIWTGQIEVVPKAGGIKNTDRVKTLFQASGSVNESFNHGRFYAK